jgi:4'-phosphopantetheinyl transferase
MSEVEVLLVAAGQPERIPPDMLEALSPDEHARALRFHAIQDLWLFVLGRALLRYGLREHLGIERPRLVLSANGKPRLDPADGMEFNLSHTYGYVACAFGQGCELGVDVERCDRLIDGDGVANAYFSTSERDLLERAGVAERPELFVRIWTFKEAVIKAAGLGLSFELDRFAVALDPPRLHTIAPELGEPRLWVLHEWLVADGCRLALAIRRPDEGPVTVKLTDVPLRSLVKDRLSSAAAR